MAEVGTARRGLMRPPGYVCVVARLTPPRVLLGSSPHARSRIPGHGILGGASVARTPCRRTANLPTWPTKPRRSHPADQVANRHPNHTGMGSLQYDLTAGVDIRVALMR